MLIINHVLTWHRGEPLPVPEDIFALLASGDELDALNDALAHGRIRPVLGPTYVASGPGDAEFLYFALAHRTIRGWGRAA